ncbi:N-acetylmuramoyl-L-alanine amidase [Clostridium saudiense]|uniref:N-acetylmuramoyl-L-alanine amidase n=1 Tax=Clostridium saudiense TaxID=1414720 RepID=UPI0018AC6AE6|nr:N-acetylmuramoyl-L-alanine amidase [Clostridium saudiense]
MEIKKIAVRGGHTELCTGASALIDELTEDRKVTAAVIKYLRELGYEVLDVTPPVNYTSSSSTDLLYGVNKANEWGADLFVSIHFNKAYDSYNGALGSEVCVYSNYDIAQRVVNALGELGFRNRGQKIRTNLYELRNTNMKSMIVETCFVEATEDVALYRKLGSDAIGKAIAEAISNKKINEYKKVHVREYLNIKPFNAGFGIYKDDSSWELWNRIAYLGCPISAIVLDNPSKNVYKVKDCRYGFEGYCYIEENNNTTFTSYQAYAEKEESKEVLFKIIADGVQVTDLCKAKWIPDMIEEQLKKGVKDIKILECN